MLDVALDYYGRGWVVLPIALKAKRTTAKDWPTLRLSEAAVRTAFAKPCNVGVHLGPSGLIDIDLDCTEARELAARILPPTATFGRASNPSSHYVYAGCVPMRQFKDPIDKKMILEIRSGDGKQTVFPGSVHTSGEEIDWDSDVEISDVDPSKAAAELAVRAWCEKHRTTQIPDSVAAWLRDPNAPSPVASSSTAPDVMFEGSDDALIEAIVTCCPEGSRHDYRLACAGAMYRSGVAESSAAEMLARAMADERLGKERDDAEVDARASVRDTYHTERPFTGAATLVSEFSAKAVVDRIDALCTPDLKSIDWLEKLKAAARGNDPTVLSDNEIINSLARMMLAKDSRLPVLFAELEDSIFAHTKSLRTTVKLRAGEIEAKNKERKAEQLPAKHPESGGAMLPSGYLVQDGRLIVGEQTIMVGELELLAKCPAADGVHARIAYRTPSNPIWKTTVVPYRHLVDTRSILTLADHGLNVSSLEAPLIVGYVRDYVGANEKLLDRPIATQTGWHESGAFIWGRTVINGPKDLRAEFAANDQIALGFVASLRSEGDREASYAALREAVETLPAAAMCIAASLAAPLVRKRSRQTIGIHLAGMGGKGKTRTLKIAGSIWGETGSPTQLIAGGVIGGANTTLRAFEMMAAARNELPLLASDVRPFPGLTETMHAIINGDPRARATRTGGSTQGSAYACGAVITEGELNVLSLTTRQGFHRRMLELEPDPHIGDLWRLGEVCSRNFGFLGPEFVSGALPEAADFVRWQEQLTPAYGHDVAANIATLITVAEHAAPLLGADARKWCANILRTLNEDRVRRNESGATQGERVLEDLFEIVGDVSSQLADNIMCTRSASSRPWLGYWDGDDRLVLKAATLREALVKRGHDAISDAIHGLMTSGAIKPISGRIAGIPLKCFEIQMGAKNAKPDNSSGQPDVY